VALRLNPLADARGCIASRDAALRFGTPWMVICQKPQA